jgi:hypothetical protein
VLWAALVRRERPDPIVAVLCAYCAALTLYCTRGAPDWLASASLLAHVPDRRSTLGIGFADTLAWIAFLARARAKETSPSPAAALGVAAAWALVLASCSVRLRSALPDTNAPMLALAVIANGVIGFLALRGMRPVLVTAAVAAAVATTTLRFNPIAVGGSDHLLHNPVSEMILDVDREAGGDTIWISYGDEKIANLFRVLGVQAVDGVHPTPQLELWSRIDPTGADRSRYNRFAHVYAGMYAPAGRFMPAQDTLYVGVGPEEEELRRLGVTHLLVRVSDPRFAIGFGSYEPAGRAGFYAAFELPLRSRSRSGSLRVTE